MSNTKTEQLELDLEEKAPKKVDEDSGVHVSGHIKIFDPNTDEVFVSKREDG